MGALKLVNSPAALVRIFATSRLTIPLLLLGGAAVRLVWVFFSNRLMPLNSEMQRVSAVLAETGAIADAYRLGSGPTTHVGPFAPWPGALAYRLFGTGTPAAELLLTLVALAVIGGTLLVLDRVFAALDEPPLARRLAIAVFALFPVFMGLEAQDFRIRETAWSALIVAALLLYMLRLEDRRDTRWRSLLALALVSALLFLLSPSAGVVAYAACGVFALRNLPVRRWPATAALAAAALFAVSLPWALRNRSVLGEMVWSRGNVGIELALGTNAAAVDPPDPVRYFVDSMQRVHPAQSDAAYARMREMGELAYSRMLAAESWAWIGANPGDTARIWLRHVYEFYFAPRWIWHPYGEKDRSDLIRATFVGATTAVAFGALIWFLVAGRHRYFYVAAVVAASVVPFVMAQPRTRYRYVIAALLVFLACAGAVRALTRLGLLAAPAATPSPAAPRGDERPTTT